MFKLKRNRLKASVLAAALAALPLGAHAAGLGKLTVLSPLGQPLQAELELTASREELSSLAAKVASAEAFKKAGIDYAPVLTGIRITVDKRSDGQPFLRLQTLNPVNDPFVDMLVDVTWSSGRLVREYTFLLDPPEALKMAPAAATIAAPTVAPAAEIKPAAKGAEQPMAVSAAEAKPGKKPAAEAKAGKAPSQPQAVAGTREVKRGDYLAKIANETKPEGVSLDQMLVALFRGNKDAFDGANMNRLKAGKILNIPEPEAAAAVAPGEARKIVVAQAGDFNAYRKKLAAAAAGGEAAKEEAPKQAAVGKITPKVEEKAPAAPAGKDKLAVSRTETAKDAKAAGRITALEEDLVARDKALKDASGRIVELERNLNDLKKLAELKSQAGAQLQQQAQAAKAAAPEAKKPEPAPAPAPAAAPVAPPPAAAPVEAKAPEAPAEKPAEAAKPAEAPAPAPAVKKPLPPPPPPAPEPSFIEENGTLVFGGGALLLALAGYLGYSTWRRKRQGGDMGATSRISEGDLTASSVFGTTGGQSVDTSSNVSLQTDFSQSGMSAIDADEGVDPVAEADVYMAYGRDTQAEEILLDALKTDPTRHAIHLKLLEIYAARKNLKQFETLATDLYGQTSGTGPDWEKAAALGHTLDPANPLYGGKAGGEAPTPNMAELAAATLVVPATEMEKMSDTVTMPGQLAHMAAVAEVAPPAAPETLGFDMGLGAPAAAAPQPAAKPAEVEEVTSLDFDLDLGGPAETPAPVLAEPAHLDVELEMPPLAAAMPAAEESNAIDFNLDLEAPAPAVAPAAAPSAPEPSHAVDFDFDLGALAAEAPAVEPAAPALDLSAISLDLGAAPAPAAHAAPAAPPAGADNPEVATKIELAQAYEEMGDKEGARELLQEVLNEGSSAQQQAARQKLAALEA